MTAKSAGRAVRAVVAAGFGALFLSAAVASSAFACSPNALIFTGFVGFPPDLSTRVQPPGPRSALPGSDVLVNGLEFEGSTSENPVEIRWNSVTGADLGSAAGPSFSVRITLPSASPGVYYIVAVQRSLTHSGASWKRSVPFEIRAPAVVDEPPRPPIEDPPVDEADPVYDIPPVEVLDPVVVNAPPTGLPNGLSQIPGPGSGSHGTPPGDTGGKSGGPPSASTGKPSTPPTFGPGGARVVTAPGFGAARRIASGGAAALPARLPDSLGTPGFVGGSDPDSLATAPAQGGLWRGGTSSGRAPSLFDSSGRSGHETGSPIGVALTVGGVLTIAAVGTATRRRRLAVANTTADR